MSSVGSAGWFVAKRVNFFLSIVTAFLNSPSMLCSVIVTWLTLLLCTSRRNCGEYAMWARGFLSGNVDATQ